MPFFIHIFHSYVRMNTTVVLVVYFDKDLSYWVTVSNRSVLSIVCSYVINNKYFLIEWKEIIINLFNCSAQNPSLLNQYSHSTGKLHLSDTKVCRRTLKFIVFISFFVISHSNLQQMI